MATAGDGDAAARRREENNNEVDELSRELSSMGCVAGALKPAPPPPPRSPGQCRPPRSPAREEEAYLSDEFEAESARSGDEAAANDGAGGGGGGGGAPGSRASCPALRGGRAGGDAPRHGPAPPPRARRLNMSFSNERLRDIERDNRILLDKILSARHPRRGAGPGPARAPAALARTQQQRRIDKENLILMRKIERAASSCSARR